MLLNGVSVEYRDDDGDIRSAQVHVSNHSTNNDRLAPNQFTIAENRNHRRLDIVPFVNGLSLGIVKLKNLGVTTQSSLATASGKTDLLTLFAMNGILVVSDRMEARRYHHLRVGRVQALVNPTRRCTCP